MATPNTTITEKVKNFFNPPKTDNQSSQVPRDQIITDLTKDDKCPNGSFFDD